MFTPDARSGSLELLDGDRFDAAEYRTTLEQIETINRWTGAYGPTIRAVSRVARRDPARKYRVLDIGFGHGDTLRALRRWSRQSGVELELVGIDLNPRAAEIAKRATPTSDRIDFLVGDVFRAESLEVDIVINALMMHHLDDASIVRLLAWMTERAELAWYISDLHRHPVPFHFIRVATSLMSFNRLIRHDAPLSVARAFLRDDWTRYIRAAGLDAASTHIRWHLPFRYGVFCDTIRARGAWSEKPADFDRKRGHWREM